MHIHRSPGRRSAHWPTWATTGLFLLIAAGCSNPFAAPDPSAQATIEALAASNAQLSTQVAELAAAAGLPTPLPPGDNTAAEAAAGVAASAAPAGLPPAPEVTPRGQGPLPQLLAAIPLAAAGETLYDFRLDRATNHIFVSDSADQLHVLDATTYAPLTVLPYGGWLELDEVNHRLYVYTPYVTPEPGVIIVIDTETLAEVGSLSGRALSIDVSNNRLFVGEPYVISAAEDVQGVRIVDGRTLQQTGIFTQSGAPTYNPVSGDLLIAAYTLYTADPDTLQVTGDLFPDLTDTGDGGFLWCNGCAWVDMVEMFATDEMIAVAINHHCAGKGCGPQEAPRFLNASTLQPIAAATAPQLQAGCGSQFSLVDQVGERRYVNQVFDRYVVFNNLLVTTADGQPLTLRDGLRLDYVNSSTGQGYLYDGTVLDLAQLEPIGRWTAACLMGVEESSGLLFGHRSGSLYVIAESGGDPVAPAPPANAPLPSDWPVSEIAVSPNYAVDGTLLALSGDAIYRSTDRGAQWQRLAGGLPTGQGSQWVVAFSPTYSVDGTIFAAGERNEYWGEGIWRSTDGGDTWQAGWDGLEHRRITAIQPAPNFVVDQTLVVQADYYTVATGETGVSYQQSTDGGLSWTLVATSSVAGLGAAALPPLSELLPGYAPSPALPVRLNDLRNGLQVTLDGITYVGVPLSLPETDWFDALLTAPSYPAEPVIYALGHLSLWRSDDNGATWSPWQGARLDGMDYTNQLSSGAIATVAGGGHHLVLGTADGEVWVLDPAQMVWGEAVAAAPAPTPAPAAAASVPISTPMAAATGAATLTPARTPVSTLATPLTSTVSLTGTASLTSTAPVTGPAAAPTPAVTAVPLAGDPPGGMFRPQGSLGIVWQANPAIQQAVGWARQETPTVVNGAWQRFENGVMVWRADTSQIFAFLNDGTWQSFPDTFEEGDQESDLRYAPPAGKQQPIRGFGKVWREHAALREKLGWALAKEEAQVAEVQSFERGQMLRYGPLLFTVIGVDTAEGRWR